jgi:CheY-like chemotaxis protein
MNGFEATRAIRQREGLVHTKPVPIIALSGYTQDRERQAAKVAGMNDYLAKPVRSKDLFDKILSFTRGSVEKKKKNRKFDPPM